MANNIPFQEMGKTVRINVSTTANTVAITADSPCNQLRIHNGTAAEVFIRCGTTSTSNVAIPATGMATLDVDVVAQHPHPMLPFLLLERPITEQSYIIIKQLLLLHHAYQLPKVAMYSMYRQS